MIDNSIYNLSVRKAESVCDVVCAPWLVTKKDQTSIAVLALAYIVPVTGAARKSWSWTVCIIPTVLSALNMVYNYLNRKWDIASAKEKCLAQVTHAESEMVAYVKQAQDFDIDTAGLVGYQGGDFQGACNSLREKARVVDFTEEALQEIQRDFRALNTEVIEHVHEINEEAQRRAIAAKEVFDGKVEEWKSLEGRFGEFGKLFVFATLRPTDGDFNELAQWDKKLRVARGIYNTLERKFRGLSAKLRTFDAGFAIRDADELVAEAEKLRSLIDELSTQQAEEAFQEKVLTVWSREIDLYIQDAQNLQSVVGDSANMLGTKITQLQNFKSSLDIDSLNALKLEFDATHKAFTSLARAEQTSRTLFAAQTNNVLERVFKGRSPVHYAGTQVSFEGETFRFQVRRNGLVHFVPVLPIVLF